jgi:mRNA interferase HicA
VKRSSLLQPLRRHGCSLKREGAAHSLWTNPATGAVEAIPRHNENPEYSRRKGCRGLSVPTPAESDSSCLTPAFQPRRLIIAPAADGCKRMLGGTALYFKSIAL